MPTYEYVCLSCGTHVEVYQHFSDEPLKKCGVCGGELRKVFHPAGILFKGSGFYKTDSRKGKKAASAPSSSDTTKEKREQKEPAVKKESAQTSSSSPGSDSSSGSSSSSGSDSSAGSGSKERSA